MTSAYDLGYAVGMEKDAIVGPLLSGAGAVAKGGAKLIPKAWRWLRGAKPGMKPATSFWSRGTGGVPGMLPGSVPGLGGRALGVAGSAGRSVYGMGKAVMPWIAAEEILRHTMGSGRPHTGTAPSPTPTGTPVPKKDPSDLLGKLMTPYALGETGLSLNPLGGIVGGLGGLGLSALMDGDEDEEGRRKRSLLSNPVLMALLLGGAGAVLPGALGGTAAGAAKGGAA